MPVLVKQEIEVTQPASSDYHNDVIDIESSADENKKSTSVTVNPTVTTTSHAPVVTEEPPHLTALGSDVTGDNDAAAGDSQTGEYIEMTIGYQM